MLDLETLMRVPYVEPDLGYDISPDGSLVAFSSNPKGRWEIYSLDLTKPGSHPEQISSGEGASSLSTCWQRNSICRSGSSTLT